MHNDVIISGRIRIARNFAGMPYACRMSPELGEKSQLRAANALKRAPESRDYLLLRIRDLPDLPRRLLEEKQLISRTLFTYGESAALLLRRDEQASIMINGEDHLHFHVQRSGSMLQDLSEEAFAVESAIGENERYAYDDQLGYLTCNPANAGTGMRGTVLMHLPALMRANAIGTLTRDASRVNLALRPLGRRDGAPQGDLFLLENQASLGFTEESLLTSVDQMARELINRERQARETLLLSDDLRLEDRLYRSFGILRNARRLGEAEWLRRWSDVRLGVQAGYFPLALHTLDTLLTDMRPAHLEQGAGKELSPTEREERRALLVREVLETTHPCREPA
ncbi:MAG: ATP--guanido phosphotransferase [Clostridia bacterium]|nr:ATP--guanido phosphotransferase [Clostridia bacterium]